jgi:hypothetical protein
LPKIFFPREQHTTQARFFGSLCQDPDPIFKEREQIHMMLKRNYVSTTQQSILYRLKIINTVQNKNRRFYSYLDGDMPIVNPYSN